MDTVIETKTKFLESKFFVVGTKNINLLLSGVTFPALNLIKINKSKHLCFTIDNMKNDNTQKEEMKANNETKIHPAHLRHIEKQKKKKKNVSEIKLKTSKIVACSVKLHIDSSVSPAAQRERRIFFALHIKMHDEHPSLFCRTTKYF